VASDLPLEAVEDQLVVAGAAGDVVVDLEEARARREALARLLEDEGGAAVAGLLREDLQERVEAAIEGLGVGELDLGDPVEGVEAGLVLGRAEAAEKAEEADLVLAVAARL